MSLPQALQPNLADQFAAFIRDPSIDCRQLIDYVASNTYPINTSVDTINAINSTGYSYLHEAIIAQKWSFARYLITQCFIDLNIAPSIRQNRNIIYILIEYTTTFTADTYELLSLMIHANIKPDIHNDFGFSDVGASAFNLLLTHPGVTNTVWFLECVRILGWSIVSSKKTESIAFQYLYITYACGLQSLYLSNRHLYTRILDLLCIMETTSCSQLDHGNVTAISSVPIHFVDFATFRDTSDINEHETYTPCWLTYAICKFPIIYSILSKELKHQPLALYCGYLRHPELDTIHANPQASQICSPSPLFSNQSTTQTQPNSSSQSQSPSTSHHPSTTQSTTNYHLVSDLSHFTHSELANLESTLEDKFTALINNTKQRQFELGANLTVDILHSILLLELTLQKYDVISAALIHNRLIESSTTNQYNSILSHFNSFFRNDPIHCRHGRELGNQVSCGTAKASFYRSDLSLWVDKTSNQSKFCSRTGKRFETSPNNGPEVNLDLVYYLDLRFGDQYICGTDAIVAHWKWSQSSLTNQHISLFKRSFLIELLRQHHSTSEIKVPFLQCFSGVSNDHSSSGDSNKALQVLFSLPFHSTEPLLEIISFILQLLAQYYFPSENRSVYYHQASSNTTSHTLENADLLSFFDDDTILSRVTPIKQEEIMSGNTKSAQLLPQTFSIENSLQKKIHTPAALKTAAAANKPWLDGEKKNSSNGAKKRSNESSSEDDDSDDDYYSSEYTETDDTSSASSTSGSESDYDLYPAPMSALVNNAANDAEGKFPGKPTPSTSSTTTPRQNPPKLHQDHIFLDGVQLALFEREFLYSLSNSTVDHIGLRMKTDSLTQQYHLLGSLPTYYRSIKYRRKYSSSIIRVTPPREDSSMMHYSTNENSANMLLLSDYHRFSTMFFDKFNKLKSKINSQQQHGQKHQHQQYEAHSTPTKPNYHTPTKPTTKPTPNSPLLLNSTPQTRSTAVIHDFDHPDHRSDTVELENQAHYNLLEQTIGLSPHNTVLIATDLDSHPQLGVDLFGDVFTPPYTPNGEVQGAVQLFHLLSFQTLFPSIFHQLHGTSNPNWFLATNRQYPIYTGLRYKNSSHLLQSTLNHYMRYLPLLHIVDVNSKRLNDNTPANNSVSLPPEYHFRNFLNNLPNWTLPLTDLHYLNWLLNQVQLYWSCINKENSNNYTVLPEMSPGLREAYAQFARLAPFLAYPLQRFVKAYEAVNGDRKQFQLNPHSPVTKQGDQNEVQRKSAGKSISDDKTLKLHSFDQFARFQATTTYQTSPRFSDAILSINHIISIIVANDNLSAEMKYTAIDFILNFTPSKHPIMFENDIEIQLYNYLDKSALKKAQKEWKTGQLQHEQLFRDRIRGFRGPQTTTTTTTTSTTSTTSTADANGTREIVLDEDLAIQLQHFSELVGRDQVSFQETYTTPRPTFDQHFTTPYFLAQNLKKMTSETLPALLELPGSIFVNSIDAEFELEEHKPVSSNNNNNNNNNTSLRPTQTTLKICEHYTGLTERMLEEIEKRNSLRNDDNDGDDVQGFDGNANAADDEENATPLLLERLGDMSISELVTFFKQNPTINPQFKPSSTGSSSATPAYPLIPTITPPTSSSGQHYYHSKLFKAYAKMYRAELLLTKVEAKEPAEEYNPFLTHKWKDRLTVSNVAQIASIDEFTAQLGVEDGLNGLNSDTAKVDAESNATPSTSSPVTPSITIDTPLSEITLPNTDHLPFKPTFLDFTQRFISPKPSSLPSSTYRHAPHWMGDSLNNTMYAKTLVRLGNDKNDYSTNFALHPHSNHVTAPRPNESKFGTPYTTILYPLNIIHDEKTLATRSFHLSQVATDADCDQNCSPVQPNLSTITPLHSTSGYVETIESLESFYSLINLAGFTSVVPIKFHSTSPAIQSEVVFPTVQTTMAQLANSDILTSSKQLEVLNIHARIEHSSQPLVDQTPFPLKLNEFRSGFDASASTRESQREQQQQQQPTTTTTTTTPTDDDFPAHLSYSLTLHTPNPLSNIGNPLSVPLRELMSISQPINHSGYDRPTFLANDTRQKLRHPRFLSHLPQLPIPTPTPTPPVTSASTAGIEPSVPPAVQIITQNVNTDAILADCLLPSLALTSAPLITPPSMVQPSKTPKTAMREQAEFGQLFEANRYNPFFIKHNIDVLGVESNITTYTHCFPMLPKEGAMINASQNSLGSLIQYPATPVYFTLLKGVRDKSDLAMVLRILSNAMHRYMVAKFTEYYSFVKVAMDVHSEAIEHLDTVIEFIEQNYDLQEDNQDGKLKGEGRGGREGAITTPSHVPQWVLDNIFANGRNNSFAVSPERKRLLIAAASYAGQIGQIPPQSAQTSISAGVRGLASVFGHTQASTAQVPKDLKETAALPVSASTTTPQASLLSPPSSSTPSFFTSTPLHTLFPSTIPISDTHAIQFTHIDKSATSTTISQQIKPSMKTQIFRASELFNQQHLDPSQPMSTDFHEAAFFSDYYLSTMDASRCSIFHQDVALQVEAESFVGSLTAPEFRTPLHSNNCATSGILYNTHVYPVQRKSYHYLANNQPLPIHQWVVEEQEAIVKPPSNRTAPPASTLPLPACVSSIIGATVLYENTSRVYYTTNPSNPTIRSLSFNQNGLDQCSSTTPSPAYDPHQHQNPYLANVIAKAMSYHYKPNNQSSTVDHEPIAGLLSRLIPFDLTPYQSDQQTLLQQLRQEFDPNFVPNQVVASQNSTRTNTSVTRVSSAPNVNVTSNTINASQTNANSLISMTQDELDKRKSSLTGLDRRFTHHSDFILYPDDPLYREFRATHGFDEEFLQDRADADKRAIYTLSKHFVPPISLATPIKSLDQLKDEENKQNSNFFSQPTQKQSASSTALFQVVLTYAKTLKEHLTTLNMTWERELKQVYKKININSQKHSIPATSMTSTTLDMLNPSNLITASQLVPNQRSYAEDSLFRHLTTRFTYGFHISHLLWMNRPTLTLYSFFKDLSKALDNDELAFSQNHITYQPDVYQSYKANVLSRYGYRNAAPLSLKSELSEFLIKVSMQTFASPEIDIARRKTAPFKLVPVASQTVPTNLGSFEITIPSTGRGAPQVPYLPIHDPPPAISHHFHAIPGSLKLLQAIDKEKTSALMVEFSKLPQNQYSAAISGISLPQLALCLRNGQGGAKERQLKPQTQALDENPQDLLFRHFGSNFDIAGSNRVLLRRYIDSLHYTTRASSSAKTKQVPSSSNSTRFDSILDQRRLWEVLLHFIDSTSEISEKSLLLHTVAIYGTLDTLSLNEASEFFAYCKDGLAHTIHSLARFAMSSIVQSRLSDLRPQAVSNEDFVNPISSSSCQPDNHGNYSDFFAWAKFAYFALFYFAKFSPMVHIHAAVTDAPDIIHPHYHSPFGIALINALKDLTPSLGDTVDNSNNFATTNTTSTSSSVPSSATATPPITATDFFHSSSLLCFNIFTSIMHYGPVLVHTQPIRAELSFLQAQEFTQEDTLSAQLNFSKLINSYSSTFMPFFFPDATQGTKQCIKQVRQHNLNTNINTTTADKSSDNALVNTTTTATAITPNYTIDFKKILNTCINVPYVTSWLAQYKKDLYTYQPFHQLTAQQIETQLNNVELLLLQRIWLQNVTPSLSFHKNLHTRVVLFDGFAPEFRAEELPLQILQMDKAISVDLKLITQPVHRRFTPHIDHAMGYLEDLVAGKDLNGPAVNEIVLTDVEYELYSLHKQQSNTALNLLTRNIDYVSYRTTYEAELMQAFIFHTTWYNIRQIYHELVPKLIKAAKDILVLLQNEADDEIKKNFHNNFDFFLATMLDVDQLDQKDALPIFPAKIDRDNKDVASNDATTSDDLEGTDLDSQLTSTTSALLSKTTKTVQFTKSSKPDDFAIDDIKSLPGSMLIPISYTAFSTCCEDLKGAFVAEVGAANRYKKTANTTTLPSNAGPSAPHKDTTASKTPRNNISLATPSTPSAARDIKQQKPLSSELSPNFDLFPYFTPKKRFSTQSIENSHELQSANDHERQYQYYLQFQKTATISYLTAFLAELDHFQTKINEYPGLSLTPETYGLFHSKSQFGSEISQSSSNVYQECISPPISPLHSYYAYLIPTLQQIHHLSNVCAILTPSDYALKPHQSDTTTIFGLDRHFHAKLHKKGVKYPLNEAISDHLFAPFSLNPSNHHAHHDPQNSTTAPLNHIKHLFTHPIAYVPPTFVPKHISTMATWNTKYITYDGLNGKTYSQPFTGKASVLPQFHLISNNPYRLISDYILATAASISAISPVTRFLVQTLSLAAKHHVLHGLRDTYFSVESTTPLISVQQLMKDVKHTDNVVNNHELRQENQHAQSTRQKLKFDLNALPDLPELDTPTSSQHSPTTTGKSDDNTQAIQEDFNHIFGLATDTHTNSPSNTDTDMLIPYSLESLPTIITSTSIAPALTNSTSTTPSHIPPPEHNYHLLSTSDTSIIAATEINRTTISPSQCLFSIPTIWLLTHSNLIAGQFICNDKMSLYFRVSPAVAPLYDFLIDTAGAQLDSSYLFTQEGMVLVMGLLAQCNAQLHHENGTLPNLRLAKSILSRSIPHLVSKIVASHQISAQKAQNKDQVLPMASYYTTPPTILKVFTQTSPVLMELKPPEQNQGMRLNGERQRVKRAHRREYSAKKKAATVADRTTTTTKLVKHSDNNVTSTREEGGGDTTVTTTTGTKRGDFGDETTVISDLDGDLVLPNVFNVSDVTSVDSIASSAKSSALLPQQQPFEQPPPLLSLPSFRPALTQSLLNITTPQTNLLTLAQKPYYYSTPYQQFFQNLFTFFTSNVPHLGSLLLTTIFAFRRPPSTPSSTQSSRDQLPIESAPWDTNEPSPLTNIHVELLEQILVDFGLSHSSPHWSLFSPLSRNSFSTLKPHSVFDVALSFASSFTPEQTHKFLTQALLTTMFQPPNAYPFIMPLDFYFGSEEHQRIHSYFASALYLCPEFNTKITQLLSPPSLTIDSTPGLSTHAHGQEHGEVFDLGKDSAESDRTVVGADRTTTTTTTTTSPITTTTTPSSSTNATSPTKTTTSDPQDTAFHHYYHLLISPSRISAQVCHQKPEKEGKAKSAPIGQLKDHQKTLHQLLPSYPKILLFSNLVCNSFYLNNTTNLITKTADKYKTYYSGFLSPITSSQQTDFYTFTTLSTWLNLRAISKLPIALHTEKAVHVINKLAEEHGNVPTIHFEVHPLALKFDVQTHSLSLPPSTPSFYLLTDRLARMVLQQGILKNVNNLHRLVTWTQPLTLNDFLGGQFTPSYYHILCAQQLTEHFQLSLIDYQALNEYLTACAEENSKTTKSITAGMKANYTGVDDELRHIMTTIYSTRHPEPEFMKSDDKSETGSFRSDLDYDDNDKDDNYGSDDDDATYIGSDFARFIPSTLGSATNGYSEADDDGYDDDKQAANEKRWSKITPTLPAAIKFAKCDPIVLQSMHMIPNWDIASIDAYRHADDDFSTIFQSTNILQEEHNEVNNKLFQLINDDESLSDSIKVKMGQIFDNSQTPCYNLPPIYTTSPSSSNASPLTTRFSLALEDYSALAKDFAEILAQSDLVQPILFHCEPRHAALRDAAIDDILTNPTAPQPAVIDALHAIVLSQASDFLTDRYLQSGLIDTNQAHPFMTKSMQHLSIPSTDNEDLTKYCFLHRFNALFKRSLAHFHDKDAYSMLLNTQQAQSLTDQWDVSAAAATYDPIATLYSTTLDKYGYPQYDADVAPTLPQFALLQSIVTLHSNFVYKDISTRIREMNQEYAACDKIASCSAVGECGPDVRDNRQLYDTDSAQYDDYDYEGVNGIGFDGHDGYLASNKQHVDLHLISHPATSTSATLPFLAPNFIIEPLPQLSLFHSKSLFSTIDRAFGSSVSLSYDYDWSLDPGMQSYTISRINYKYSLKQTIFPSTMPFFIQFLIKSGFPTQVLPLFMDIPRLSRIVKQAHNSSSLTTDNPNGMEEDEKSSSNANSITIDQKFQVLDDDYDPYRMYPRAVGRMTKMSRNILEKVAQKDKSIKDLLTNTVGFVSDPDSTTTLFDPTNTTNKGRTAKPNCTSPAKSADTAAFTVHKPNHHILKTLDMISNVKHSLQPTNIYKSPLAALISHPITMISIYFKFFIHEYLYQTHHITSPFFDISTAFFEFQIEHDYLAKHEQLLNLLSTLPPSMLDLTSLLNFIAEYDPSKLAHPTSSIYFNIQSAVLSYDPTLFDALPNFTLTNFGSVCFCGKSPFIAQQSKQINTSSLISYQHIKPSPFDLTCIEVPHLPADFQPYTPLIASTTTTSANNSNSNNSGKSLLNPQPPLKLPSLTFSHSSQSVQSVHTQTKLVTLNNILDYIPETRQNQFTREAISDFLQKNQSPPEYPCLFCHYNIHLLPSAAFPWADVVINLQGHNLVSHTPENLSSYLKTVSATIHRTHGLDHVEATTGNGYKAAKKRHDNQKKDSAAAHHAQLGNLIIPGSDYGNGASLTSDADSEIYKDPQMHLNLKAMQNVDADNTTTHTQPHNINMSSRQSTASAGIVNHGSALTSRAVPSGANNHFASLLSPGPFTTKLSTSHFTDDTGVVQSSLNNNTINSSNHSHFNRQQQQQHNQNQQSTQHQHLHSTTLNLPSSLSFADMNSDDHGDLEDSTTFSTEVQNQSAATYQHPHNALIRSADTDLIDRADQFSIADSFATVTEFAPLIDQNGAEIQGENGSVNDNNELTQEDDEVDQDLTKLPYDYIIMLPPRFKISLLTTKQREVLLKHATHVANQKQFILWSKNFLSYPNYYSSVPFPISVNATQQHFYTAVQAEEFMIDHMKNLLQTSNHFLHHDFLTTIDQQADPASHSWYQKTADDLSDQDILFTRLHLVPRWPARFTTSSTNSDTNTTAAIPPSQLQYANTNGLLNYLLTTLNPNSFSIDDLVTLLTDSRLHVSPSHQNTNALLPIHLAIMLQYSSTFLITIYNSVLLSTSFTGPEQFLQHTDVQGNRIIDYIRNFDVHSWAPEFVDLVETAMRQHGLDF